MSQPTRSGIETGDDALRADAADERARVQALRTLLWTFIALTGLIALIGSAVGSYREAAISAAGGAVYALILLSVRRWGVHRAGFLCTLWYFALATAAIVAGRGIYDVTIVLFPAGIFMGALLLRRAHVLALLALSVAIVATVGTANSVGWLNLNSPRPAPIAEVVVASLLLLAVGVIAQFVVLNLTAMVRDRRSAEQALLQSKGEIEARNRALQIVNELVHRLHRNLDITAIAHETVDVLVRHSQPPLVAFYLLEGDRSRVRLIADHGFTAEERAIGAYLPVEGSLSGLAIAEQRIVSSDDLLADSRAHRGIAEALARRGIASAMAVPLVFDGESLGSMNLIFKVRMSFGPLEIDTFKAIGQAVSLAIANARHMADLEHQAFHDPLTGLPNRAGLHREFLTLARGGAPPERRIGLVLLDLNRFREINEALGHHVGDQLLSQIAPRLAAAVADGPGAVFRLGGDEFAVLLAGLDGTSEAEPRAHRLLAALKAPFEVGGMALEVAASAGVAVWPEDGRDSHELLRCADVALEHSKRRSVAVISYEAALDEHTPERLALLSELGSAIREGGLVLHFQPTVMLGSGAVVGFEALVRWQHPRLGLLQPAAFLPFAELTEVIHPLTYWIVEDALKAQRLWDDAGFHIGLAVNLSVRNLLDGNCTQRLEEIFARARVDPTRVEFELTETALMSDPETAIKALSRITATGAHLAIDDFGTGYSSLAHLERLPVQALKIDRSFVSDMLTKARSLAIVRSTVQLGRSLGLRVVAEGVEDGRTAEALGEMGCEFAQGFFFGSPVPAEEVGRRLAAGLWSTRKPGAAAP